MVVKLTFYLHIYSRSNAGVANDCNFLGSARRKTFIPHHNPMDIPISSDYGIRKLKDTVLVAVIDPVILI